MGEIFETITQVRRNWKKYEPWEKQQERLELAKKEYLKQNPASAQQKLEAEKYGNTIIRAINVMDEYSEDKAEDMENATQAGKMVPIQIASFAGAGLGTVLGIKMAKGKLPIIYATTFAGSIITTLAASIPLDIYATKAQVWASKVARFQAREKELKDPKNFVIYTPEQIAQGKKIAETLPDEEEKESKIKKIIPLWESGESVKSVVKDRKEYKEWRKKYEAEDAQIKASYPMGVPLDKKQKAHEDQQRITNAVRKINIKAEEYSENVETATKTVGAFAEVGIGATVGLGINYLIKKLNLGENSFIGKHNKAVSFLAAMVSIIGMTTYFTKLQKDAARVGRFKAKQELMDDPASFIHVDQQQLNATAQNIKVPDKNKGFFTELVNSTKQLFTSYRERQEYKKYKKTTAKEEEKLRRALKQVKVSDEQIREAKNLQDKTFNAFEKIDENSQKYTEAVELATDTAKQTIPQLIFLGLLGAGTGAFIWAEKKFGDLTPEVIVEKTLKIANKVKKLFKPIENKEFFKKYVSKLGQETLEVMESKTSSLGELLIEAIKKPTLVKTGIGVVIPPFALLFGGLYALNNYFTSLQKKAGKVGIMKAMEELEDPRYFVDKYPSFQSKPEPNKNLTPQMQRLMQIRNMGA